MVAILAAVAKGVAVVFLPVLAASLIAVTTLVGPWWHRCYFL
jgi:hypothetical protein